MDLVFKVTPELPRTVHERLEAFAESAELPPKVMFAADTAVEELLQNLLDHSEAREVRMRLAVEGNEFHVELADDGLPFNPLLMAEPDLTKPIEERDIGGLGILMVRRLMDGVRYEYRERKNWVSLAKVLR